MTTETNCSIQFHTTDFITGAVCIELGYGLTQLTTNCVKQVNASQLKTNKYIQANALFI